MSTTALYLISSRPLTDQTSGSAPLPREQCADPAAHAIVLEAGSNSAIHHDVWTDPVVGIQAHRVLSLEVPKVCRNCEYLVVRQPPASHRDGNRGALVRLLHTFLEDVHLVLNAGHLVLKVCQVRRPIDYIVDCLLAQIGSCEVPLLVSGHKLYVTRLRRSARG